MLSVLKSIFSSDDQTTPESEDKHNDVELAFAALLIEAAKSDEHYDDKEQQIITAILGKQFQLSEKDALALRQRGEEAQANAIDIHRFTKEVKTLPENEKIQFVEGLWRIVLSDGVRDEFEDALIRRICGLIYLSDRASGEARRRIENS